MPVLPAHPRTQRQRRVRLVLTAVPPPDAVPVPAPPAGRFHPGLDEGVNMINHPAFRWFVRRAAAGTVALPEPDRIAASWTRCPRCTSGPRPANRDCPGCGALAPVHS